MNNTINGLEAVLYNDALSQAQQLNRYERGMGISINNHKQGNDDLYASLKKQYQALLAALGVKTGRGDAIKITDKLPTQNTILHLMARKIVVVAAAFHTYDAYDNRTGRGSKFNYWGYNHLHFYAFGLHHLMQNHKGGVDEAVKHIKGCLFRHNKFAVADNSKNIDIKEVGVGDYEDTDIVTPTTLLDYLSLPTANPTKKCWINYIAGTIDGGKPNPILYIYQAGIK